MERLLPFVFVLILCGCTEPDSSPTIPLKSFAVEMPDGTVHRPKYLFNSSTDRFKVLCWPVQCILPSRWSMEIGVLVKPLKENAALQTKKVFLHVKYLPKAGNSALPREGKIPLQLKQFGKQYFLEARKWELWGKPILSAKTPQTKQNESPRGEYTLTVKLEFENGNTIAFPKSKAQITVVGRPHGL